MGLVMQIGLTKSLNVRALWSERPFIYGLMVQLLLLSIKILSSMEKEGLVILVGKCTVPVKLYMLRRFTN
jgi:hypothetical protein